ncbi:MAG: acetyltransferase [Clostridia bacterium]|nr:acetyltransferase [Clostridia bacterium]
MRKKRTMLKNKRLVIVGAGGHGRVVADIAKKSGAYCDLVFLDDSEEINEKVHVSGKVSSFAEYIKDSDFIIAIGNNAVRERLQRMMEGEGACFATLVHPNATVGDGVKLGRGSVVMAGAVLNSCAEVGDGVIINTCSSVDHDCRVGDYTHISVGAHVAGTVTIGSKVFVCAGVTVINNVSICDGCIIGAGATVIKNIDSSGTYVGVPANII